MDQKPPRKRAYEPTEPVSVARNHALDCVAWSIMVKNFGAGKLAHEHYAAVMLPACEPPVVAGVAARGFG